MTSSNCDLDKLIDESKILERRSTQPYFKMIYKEAKKALLSIINPRNHQLINIFRMEDDTDSQDIELAILRAILNGRLVLSIQY